MKTQTQTLILAVDLEIMAHPDLGLLDKLVFSYILNWEKKSGHCFIKDDTLSLITGENVEEIQKSIQRLVDLNLIYELKGLGGRALRAKEAESNLVTQPDLDVFAI